ncbi:hypothetical protein BKA93DRAFT_760317 [Sparassis latifolia]
MNVCAICERGLFQPVVWYFGPDLEEYVPLSDCFSRIRPLHLVFFRIESSQGLFETHRSSSPSPSMAAAIDFRRLTSLSLGIHDLRGQRNFSKLYSHWGYEDDGFSLRPRAAHVSRRGSPPQKETGNHSHFFNSTNRWRVLRGGDTAVCFSILTSTFCKDPNFLFGPTPSPEPAIRDPS